MRIYVHDLMFAASGLTFPRGLCLSFFFCLRNERQVTPSHLPTRETDRLFMWAGQMVQAPHLAVLQLGCVHAS